MSLRGFTITEGALGANVTNDNREFALIGGGVAVDQVFELGQMLVLRRVADAVALGITPAYDDANEVQMHRHISEFYRMAGEGNILVVCVVANGTTPSDMISHAEAVVLERDNVSDIAFAYNMTSLSETIANGMNSDVYAAIQPMQAFADWADANDRPLHCILECRGVSDNLGALADLRNLVVGSVSLNAHKVSLVCGQDWNYAETRTNALNKKFADVGTFLGCVAAQNWNQNPAQVDGMNLTSAPLGLWTVGGLSNHKKYSEVYADLETLNDKGYIFPIRYTGLSGYWWNDGHTCVSIVNDAAGNLNQHTIYYSHTMDMAKRALRAAYLPELKKSVELVGGKLPSGMIGYYSAVGNAVFEFLAGKGLISGGKVVVDPDSDLLVEKILNVSFRVQPTGCVNEIKGIINLSSN